MSNRSERRRKKKKHAARVSRWIHGTDLLGKSLADVLQEQARDRFLRVRFNRFGERDMSLHVIISNEECQQVLQWWPRKGTWWCPATGEKGRSLDPIEVMALASARA